MAMQADEDDLENGYYVFYGTEIADESDAKGSAFRKPVLDPGKTRAAPVTQQEPTDEQASPGWLSSCASCASLHILPQQVHTARRA